MTLAILDNLGLFFNHKQPDWQCQKALGATDGPQYFAAPAKSLIKPTFHSFGFTQDTRDKPILPLFKNVSFPKTYKTCSKIQFPWRYSPGIQWCGGKYPVPHLWRTQSPRTLRILYCFQCYNLCRIHQKVCSKGVKRDLSISKLGRKEST